MWLVGSPYYTFPSGHAMQLRGDWVYVLASESFIGDDRKGRRLVFERMAAVGPVNVQSMLPDTFGNPSTDHYVSYALTDTHAFLAVLQTTQTGTLGSLIYRIPLPR